MVYYRSGLLEEEKRFFPASSLDKKFQTAEFSRGLKIKAYSRLKEGLSTYQTRDKRQN